MVSGYYIKFALTDMVTIKMQSFKYIKIENKKRDMKTSKKISGLTKSYKHAIAW